jgi:rubrerythrin
MSKAKRAPNVPEVRRLFIPKETREQLVELKQKLHIAQADVEQAVAVFNTNIARALASVGASIPRNLVCLDCGLVYPRSGQPGPCPSCKNG